MMPDRRDRRTLRAGMVGLGMIFEETYRPLLERLHREPLFDPRVGAVDVRLTATASRTGKRAEAYRAGGRLGDFAVFTEPNSVDRLLRAPVDFVCVATPDDRHFEPCRKVLEAGKHLLVEKPSVLALGQLDELERLAQQRGVLAKVVYHKLLDPDHKRLRTLVADGVLGGVTSGYCSLLEPKQISGRQFAEWIAGRNPGTYVAVHYIKLIDFTFGGRLKSVTATGQRGIVGPADGTTWDSVQLRLVYEYPEDSGRGDAGTRGPGDAVSSLIAASRRLCSLRARPPSAAFDIHTSWVMPDNFPGYVEQEVQFRFDNGVWNGHSRKRGVELTVEGLTPTQIKSSLNNHYNAEFVEPWGERAQRGYGIEAIERFLREVAYVEHGGSKGEREARLAEMRALTYNDLAADRQVVAAVQGLEAILGFAARGHPDAVVYVNHEQGGLVAYVPGSASPTTLYERRV